MQIKKVSTGYVKIIFTILLFLMFTLLMYGCNFNNQINGTYTCKSLPFDSIVFDELDNNAFYYYYIDSEGKQIEDKGIYLKKEDNIYIIKSDIFDNTEIIHKKNKFFIKIDGKEYLFKNISDTPSLIITKTS